MLVNDIMRAYLCICKNMDNGLNRKKKPYSFAISPFSIAPSFV